MGKLISFCLIWIFWVMAFDASMAKDSTRRCPPIEGNNLKVRIKSRGRVAKFKCRKGYTMFEGDRFATCVRGQWNGKIPKCITAGCEYYDEIPHGEPLYLYNDALVQFLCLPGYSLEGSPALTCDGDQWNSTKPICRAPSNVALSCDFEEEGLCGWMNGDVDHFDWTRNQGPATAFGAGTGPNTDHTLGTSRGHYMYIESAIPKESGEKARLFSPVYSASVTDQPSCFAFYYHMFGNTTGNLNVYVKGESEDIEFLAPVYQMSGSNHDKWVLHVLQLQKIASNFQIVLEGVQGVGYMSDIAIDDVQLAQGENCNHLNEEFQNQYNNEQPETIKTTTSALTIPNHSTTPIPVDSSETSDDGDSTLASTTNQHIQPTISSVNQTLISAKPREPSLTTAISNNKTVVTTATTAAPTKKQTTTTTGHDSEEDDQGHDHDQGIQEGEDLNSCQNRCGEIAMEKNTCGCDFVCNATKTCCPDIQRHCPGYFTTPFPATLPQSTVTLSPKNVTSTTPKPTTIQQQSATTKSESKDAKTTTTVATTEVVNATTTKTSATEATVATITKIVTASTTKTLRPETTTTVKPATTSTTTKPAVVTESKTTPKPTLATTTPPKESTTIELQTTTEKPNTPEEKTTPTEEITTKFSRITTPIKPKTVKVSTTSMLPEKITKTDMPNKIYESTAAPSMGRANAAGLSRIAVFAIAIGTITAMILLIIATVAYIRKRRLAKLPEDSDIRFLARDEVMMEGNVFNLSGTISHVRNTAI